MEPVGAHFYVNRSSISKMCLRLVETSRAGDARVISLYRSGEGIPVPWSNDPARWETLP